jgi:hypothetical protein
VNPFENSKGFLFPPLPPSLLAQIPHAAQLVRAAQLAFSALQPSQLTPAARCGPRRLPPPVSRRQVGPGGRLPPQAAPGSDPTAPPLSLHRSCTRAPLHPWARASGPPCPLKRAASPAPLPFRPTRVAQRCRHLKTLDRRRQLRFASAAVSLSSWSSAGASRGGEEATRVICGCPVPCAFRRSSPESHPRRRPP